MKYGICILSFLIFGMVTLAFVFAQRRPPIAEPPRSESPAPASVSRGLFPLEVGNEWVYSDGADSFSIGVLSKIKETNGKDYFGISGFFPGDPEKVRTIRPGPLGEILEYNPGGEDFLWRRFGIFDSAITVETAGNLPCVTGSLMISGGIRESVVTPAGTFDNALQIRFQPPCADAGILTENYAEGAGLVQRVVSTIAGPRTFKLVSAHIGSLQLPKSAYSLQVSLDRPVYYNNLMPMISNPWPTARVTLAVRNTSRTPVTFAFSTSQRFDFIIRDALGNEVLRWSDGKSFLQVLGQEILTDESRQYPAEIVLKSRKGEVLPPGFYTLTGCLTPQNRESGISNMSGSIDFEIKNVY